ncbi:hypothetical protein DY000_02031474 [Brassica cretica]|uniref:Uncharacterized protein n=1 Tax=Brassica cretica TaxID=69181 RepID=A0ABQ7DMA7_BRACR|nr:hypothetical protein DY000_02031474 [Brassica cretica]
MPSSTRSNKDTQLLFSPDPASIERSIHKEARSSSIDNNTCSSLDFVQPPSTQRLVPSTNTRPTPSTEDPHLPSTDIVHPTSIDTPFQTLIDTEPRDMVATFILVRDDNGDLHDQEGHLRNAAGQRIDAQGAAILSIDAQGAAILMTNPLPPAQYWGRKRFAEETRVIGQELEKGRYAATERVFRSVAAWQPSSSQSSVAKRPFGRYDISPCILVYPLMLSPKDRSNPFHVPCHSKLSIELYRKNRGKFVIYRKKS